MAASIRLKILKHLPRFLSQNLGFAYRSRHRVLRLCNESLISAKPTIPVSCSLWNIQSRCQYTYRPRLFRGRQTLDTEGKCKNFAASLFPNEQSLLLTELQKLHDQFERECKGEIEPPSKEQLQLVLISNGIPFIGFGFLDNAIMIVAGDYIDLTIGITLGISTMAAAAFGNLVSDLAGVGLAGYVEALAAKLGVHPKKMTQEQAAMKKTRWTAGIGRALGLTIGCILGMFPLLFLETREAEETIECTAVKHDKTQ